MNITIQVKKNEKCFSTETPPMFITKEITITNEGKGEGGKNLPSKMPESANISK